METSEVLQLTLRYNCFKLIEILLPKSIAFRQHSQNVLGMHLFDLPHKQSSSKRDYKGISKNLRGFTEQQIRYQLQQCD